MGILSPHLIFLVLFCAEAWAKPSRVVSIDRGADEYLIMLAERQNIAALTWLAQKQDTSNIIEQAKGIPVTRGSVEEILLLKPDLVVGSRFSSAMKIQMLKKLHIPCFVMDSPTTFEDVREQTRKLAEVLGEQERAEKIIAQMDARLQRIKRPSGDRKRMIVFYWAGGYTSGRDTMVNSIVEAAGADNLGVRLGGAPTALRGNARISLEDLVLAKPEFIVFTNFRQDAPTVGRQILDHPALRQEKIAKNSYILPARIINSTSPMAVEAVEMLSAVLEGRGVANLAKP